MQVNVINLTESVVYLPPHQDSKPEDAIVVQPKARLCLEIRADELEAYQSQYKSTLAFKPVQRGLQ